MQQSARFIAATHPSSAPRAALLPAPPKADARAALASRTRFLWPPSLSQRARSPCCRAAARHGHGHHCQAIELLPTTALPLYCAMPCCHSTHRSLLLSHLTQSLLAAGVACSVCRRRCMPPACVARAPRPISRTSATTLGCAWTHWCSPAIRTPPTSLLRLTTTSSRAPKSRQGLRPRI